MVESAFEIYYKDGNAFAVFDLEVSDTLNDILCTSVIRKAI